MNIPTASTPKPKRKNEDKPKGLPRQRWLIAGSIALVVGLIAIAAFLMWTPGYKPMSDVPNDLLVYGQNANLYAVDFQTGERTPTTFNRDSDKINSKSKSLDGRWEIRFEFINGGYTHSNLILEDLSGEQPLRTYGTFYGADSTLSWSPDQQWVAFTAYDETYDRNKVRHAAEIWMVNTPTGEIKRLSQNDYLDSDPFFSPDGTQIAYMSAPDGHARVHVMDLATGGSRLLTPDHYGDNPKWSPDGQWIAFESWYRVDNADGSYTNHINVYIVRVDGQQGQAITVGPDQSGYLAGWKPKE